MQKLSLRTYNLLESVAIPSTEQRKLYLKNKQLMRLYTR